jgi:hypothetical protein
MSSRNFTYRAIFYHDFYLTGCDTGMTAAATQRLKMFGEALSEQYNTLQLKL